MNIFAAEQRALAEHFAGRARGEPPPEALRFVYSEGDDSGVPTIPGCGASLRCAVEASYGGGDHTILLGRVTGLRRGDAVAEPLIWFGAATSSSSASIPPCRSINTPMQAGTHRALR